MPEHTKGQDVVNLSEDVSPDEVSDIYEIIDDGVPTGIDILRLAKQIMLVAAVIIVVFGLIYIFYPDRERVKSVWNFISTTGNSVITLVIGFYFGSKR